MISRLPYVALLLLSLHAQEEKDDPKNAERLMPENPSRISHSETNQDNILISQVGKAVITESEKEMRRAKEARLEAMAEEDRKKEEAKLARIAARKSGEKEVPKECIGYNGTQNYKIARGVTLGKIGAEVYGNKYYSSLISVYNKKPANKLFLGEVLDTPSPYEIYTNLAGKAVWEKYPYAIRDCLRIHEEYKKLEPVILKERAAGDGYSDETKRKLDDMIWTLDQVKRDFYEKIEGVNEFPVSTTTQLHSAYTNLQSIRRGDLGTKNLRLDRVHLYLINGYSYAIAWGRDGFITPKK